MFFTLFAKCDALHRHSAHQHITLCVVGKVRALDAAEVRKTYLGSLGAGSFAFHHRQFELHFLAVARLFGLKVPLSLVQPPIRPPTKTNGAIGQHHFAGVVKSDRLPLRVVGLTKIAIEIRRTHITVGHHDGFASRSGVFFQHHQHRQVSVAAGVVVKIGTAFIEVKLF